MSDDGPVGAVGVALLVSLALGVGLLIRADSGSQRQPLSTPVEHVTTETLRHDIEHPGAQR